MLFYSDELGVRLENTRLKIQRGDDLYRHITIGFKKI